MQQAKLLLALAEEARLFHTPDQSPYATVPVDQHVETWSLRSTTFRHWLRRQYFVTVHSAPSAQAMTDVLSTLEAQALYDGDEIPVYLRVAEHEGNLYLDLANDAWQVVEISPEGWKLLNESPVKFRRSKGMLPLPIPASVSSGDVQELRTFLNLDPQRPEDWYLVLAYLLACFRPMGPYPILTFLGEQGTAKSSNARFLRDCIDPNIAPLRREPRDARDLMISAANGWLIVLDNLSRISDDLSDNLCRLATGGGFSTRVLYTDDEEKIFDATRPVALTSIIEVANRSDLLERIIPIQLPSIDPAQRKDEASLKARFRTAHPRILGALLTAVAAGLKSFGSIQLAELPRMADFAKWGVAIESSQGWEKGTFLKAYLNSTASTYALALDASPLVPPLRALLSKTPKWIGTATDLLARLEAKADVRVQMQRSWPKSGKSLSDALRRIAPNLRAAGIIVQWDRSADKKRARLITLEVSEMRSSEPSGASGSDNGLSDGSNMSDAPDGSDATTQVSPDPQTSVQESEEEVVDLC
ncbi:MAG: hypothetical protein KF747_15440 [Nitrospira sp.]|nr:hypothetical protein [Nitrospira sp.]